MPQSAAGRQTERIRGAHGSFAQHSSIVLTAATEPIPSRLTCTMQGVQAVRPTLPETRTCAQTGCRAKCATSPDLEHNPSPWVIGDPVRFVFTAPAFAEVDVSATQQPLPTSGNCCASFLHTPRPMTVSISKSPKMTVSHGKPLSSPPPKSNNQHAKPTRDPPSPPRQTERQANPLARPPPPGVRLHHHWREPPAFHRSMTARLAMHQRSHWGC